MSHSQNLAQRLRPTAVDFAAAAAPHDPSWLLRPRAAAPPEEGSYAAFWHAPVALTIGPWTLGADVRTWVNEGVMTLFFLVAGLEAKLRPRIAIAARPCPA